MALNNSNLDLHALKKLYGLLEIRGDGPSNPSSQCLDEKARLLLKNLLDSAAQGIFDSHSKILSAQFGVSNIPCSTQREHMQHVKPEAALRPVSSNISKAQDSVVRNSRPNLISQKITPARQKLNRVQTKPARDEGSISEISSKLSAMGTETRKRCRACDQSSRRQLTSAMPKTTKPQNPKKACGHKKGLALKPKKTERMRIGEGPSHKRTRENFQPNSSINGDETVDVVPNKEIADAIKRIEYLQLYNELSVGPTPKSRDGLVSKIEPSQDAKFVMGGNESSSNDSSRNLLQPHESNLVHESPNQSQKPASVASNDLPSQSPGVSKLRNQSPHQAPHMPLKGNDKWCQEAYEKAPFWVDNLVNELLDAPSLVRSRNVKTMVQKIDSLSRQASQNDRLSTPAQVYVQGLRVSPSPVDEMGPSQSRKGTPGRNPTDQFETINKASPVLGPTDSMGPRTRTRAPLSSAKDLPRQMMKRPSPVAYERSPLNGSHANIRVGPRNKPLPSQQESHDTTSSSRLSSSSSASSSWTTQPNSTSSSDSSDSPQMGHKMGPTPRLGKAQSRRMLRGPHQDVGPSSSEEDIGRSSRLRNKLGPTPRLGRPRSRRTLRSPHHSSSEKKIGRLRRLKNKLGLIFHHHHHHHHHHDNNHAEPLPKKHESKEEGRAIVKKAPRKDQVGHFHSLVEGLLKHVWHSKEAKPSKHSVGQLQGIPRGHKNAAKNMHWWQSLQRQGGLNKGRMKLGFNTNNTQLRRPK